MSRVQSNNNLWISVQPKYVWECGDDDGFEPFWEYNLDYDGFDWSDYSYFAKWKGIRYSTIADFTIATGLEEHGIMVDKDFCFENFETAQPPVFMPAQYMTLNIDCNAVDAGISLAGINDDYSGIAPDLGAYETNTPLPHYGVRKIDYDNDGDVDGSDLAALAALQSGLRERLTVFTVHFGRNDYP